MRVAALYDIHGNLPALEAVLEEVRLAKVDQIVVGGDAVTGPMPRETLERLLSLDVPVQFIRGNCERAALDCMTGTDSGAVSPAFEAMHRWVAQALQSEYQDMIASWPLTLRLEIEVGDVLFCHATPRDDNEVFTKLTAEDKLIPIFEESGASVVVCGHTHMQFDRTIGKVRVVNAGSIGSPFGAQGACWLLLGSEIEFHRTLYDFAKAAERVRNTQFPRAEEFAARDILNPPSEAEILERYTSFELK